MNNVQAFLKGVRIIGETTAEAIRERSFKPFEALPAFDPKSEAVPPPPAGEAMRLRTRLAEVESENVSLHEGNRQYRAETERLQGENEALRERIKELSANQKASRKKPTR